MPSTTIRYSTLPENSQSIDFGATPPPRHEWDHEIHGGLAPVPDGELDHGFDRTWIGLHFERHQAEPEPALPAHRVSGFAMPDRNAPDPSTPGAYRYDPADPASCDPSLPDSDPRSPHYEPPHLRHRPGDTFEIGGKPHDPHDPGPYGSPGWFQDRRTGRHRRGELPDPLPEDEPTMPVPSPVSTPIPAPAPPVDAPSPHPYRRARRWSLPADHREGHFGEPLGENAEPDRTGADDLDPPYRFSPLREGAMQRFLELSQPFRDAHFQPPSPSLAERLIWALSWLLCIAACGLRPAPSPLGAEREPAHGTDTDVSPLPAPLAARLPAAGGGAW